MTASFDWQTWKSRGVVFASSALQIILTFEMSIFIVSAITLAAINEDVFIIAAMLAVGCSFLGKSMKLPAFIMTGICLLLLWGLVQTMKDDARNGEPPVAIPPPLEWKGAP